MLWFANSKVSNTRETLRREREGITFESFDENLEVSPNKKTWSQEIKECYSLVSKNESFRTNS
jgi:hypothetical protein